MRFRDHRPEWMRKTPHRRSAGGSLGRWSPGHSRPYIGKGSRFYSGFDKRVYEVLCERMAQHGQLDASLIEVQVENGEVILTGNVTNRRAKRLAEDIAESVYGVRDVHNRLQFHRLDASKGQTDPAGPSDTNPASEE